MFAGARVKGGRAFEYIEQQFRTEFVGFPEISRLYA